MKKLTVLLFAILVTVIPIFASPSLRIGAKLINDYSGFYITCFDTTGKELFRVICDDSYWGCGIEAKYGPLFIFCLRLDLAELRIFKAEGGAFVLFPILGGDIICEPPFKWRVLPYVWGGGQITTYWGGQGTLDTRFLYGPEYHVRFGIGARYTLSSRIDLFGEIQLFSEDTYRVNGGHWIVGSIAVDKIQLGARFALDK